MDAFKSAGQPNTTTRARAITNLKRMSDGQSISFGWIIHWQLMAQSWDLHIEKQTSKDVCLQIFEIFAVAATK